MIQNLITTFNQRKGQKVGIFQNVLLTVALVPIVLIVAH